MADNKNIDATSLVSLVSMKNSSRDAKADNRVRQVAMQTVSCGFDGFLQSFLGKGKASRGSSSFGGRERTGSALSAKRSQSYGKYDSATAGSNMAATEKKALRRSMDKTVEDGADAAVDDDVTAAADEAARLIGNLLFGSASAPEEARPDSLRQLSGLLGGRSGGLSGTPSGMALDAWQEAIETANASAEMNNAATLSALDELLDGMPRSALEDALGRAFGLTGGAGLFNQLAATLDAQVTGVGVGEAGMLAYLNGSHGLVPGGYEDPEAPQLFADFLKETYQNGPINNTDSPDIPDADNLVAAFEKWLETNGKPKEMASGLSGDVNKFVESLAAHLRGENPAALPESMTEFFSWAVAALEGKGGDSQTAAAISGFATLFSTSEGAKTLAEVLSGDTDGKEESRQDGSAAAQAMQQTNQAAEAARNVQPTPAASMSTMMEQIENIERLADAMRMAAKGGIKNLTMQLTPDELGKVMLRVEARDGVVSAYLRVEKPEAAAQLANNLQQLRENLKAQGIELGQLDIQTRGQGEALGDFGGGRQQRDSWDGQGGRSGDRQDNSHAGAPPLTPDEEPAGTGGPGELNLFA